MTLYSVSPNTLGWNAPSEAAAISNRVGALPLGLPTFDDDSIHLHKCIPCNYAQPGLGRAGLLFDEEAAKGWLEGGRTREVDEEDLHRLPAAIERDGRRVFGHLADELDEDLVLQLRPREAEAEQVARLFCRRVVPCRGRAGGVERLLTRSLRSQAVSHDIPQVCKALLRVPM